MLLNKHIGINAAGEIGVTGDQVYKEVFALKNAGKTQLEVWINSPGGNYYHGTQIYDALKNSGLDVTTYNKGVVDSTAGWIFQAGNKRVWNNYALGLIHEVQNAGSTEQAEAVNNSIATMYAGRTHKTVAEVRALMSSSEIMNARTAVEYGFADEVDNKSDISALSNCSTDIVAVTNFGQQQIKQTLSKNSHMPNINELLGLQNEANADSQYTAIKNLVTARDTAVTQVTDLTTKLSNTNATLAETTTKLVAAESKITDAENNAKRVKAEALVNEHKGKRIANEPSVLEKWTNMAIADYDGTKTIIESININAIAPKTPVGDNASAGTGANGKPIITSAAEYFAS